MLKPKHPFQIMENKLSAHRQVEPQLARVAIARHVEKKLLILGPNFVKIVEINCSKKLVCIFLWLLVVIFLLLQS